MGGVDIRCPLNDALTIASGASAVRKGYQARQTGPIDILGFTLWADLEDTEELTYVVIPTRLKLM